jgi:beta-catenin-like protein 1
VQSTKIRINGPNTLMTHPSNHHEFSIVVHITDFPSRFIDSEADLDAALKALLPLAQAPALAYPELVRSGTVTLLIGLLSHENADIVIDVVEVVHELTDEDVGNEAEQDEDDEQSVEAALKLLIEGLVSRL